MESLWVGEYSRARKQKGESNQNQKRKFKIQNKFKTRELKNGGEINGKESGVVKV